jgi:hypothetical protein
MRPLDGAAICQVNEMQLKIEHTSVDRLIPYARNARMRSASS